MKLKKAIRDILVIIISAPKTIYFNLRHLPVKQAVKLPICISYNTHIEEYKKTKLYINSENISFGMIRLGLSKGSFQKGGKSLLHLNGGEIHIAGKTAICGGFSIIVDSGKLYIGEQFFSNANLLLNCNNKIVIHDNVLIGWNCTILDGNGHQFMAVKNEEKDRMVEIGKHTWITSEVSILNGSKIKDDCVISYGSVVHGIFQQNNVLIAGNPAKIVKENIHWKN